MTTDRTKREAQKHEEVTSHEQETGLLARLTARRVENERLGIDGRDSVEIIRELRERFAR